MIYRWKVVMEVEVEADTVFGVVSVAVDIGREKLRESVIAVLRGPPVKRVRTDAITGREICDV